MNLGFVLAAKEVSSHIDVVHNRDSPADGPGSITDTASQISEGVCEIGLQRLQMRGEGLKRSE